MREQGHRFVWQFYLAVVHLLSTFWSGSVKLTHKELQNWNMEELYAYRCSSIQILQCVFVTFGGCIVCRHVFKTPPPPSTAKIHLNLKIVGLSTCGLRVCRSVHMSSEGTVDFPACKEQVKSSLLCMKKLQKQPPASPADDTDVSFFSDKVIFTWFFCLFSGMRRRRIRLLFCVVLVVAVVVGSFFSETVSCSLTRCRNLVEVLNPGSYRTPGKITMF